MGFHPPHQTDQLGYPIDPDLRKLEFYLGDLAAKFRGAYTFEYRGQIIQEYHATMQRLYELG